MNIATLKVNGDEEALADMRDGLPTEPDSTWAKGDARPDGRTRLDWGFYVSIGADKDPATLLKQIRSYLGECRARGIHFERSDISAELRIAFTVADPAHVTPAMDLSLADLTLLVDMGISLSITS